MHKPVKELINIAVPAAGIEFRNIREALEPILLEEKMNKIRVGELMLLLEEIFVKSVEQIRDESELISVSLRRRVNELFVDISFDGPRFIPDYYEKDDCSISARIINRYREKINVKYRRGHNEITVLATRIYDRALLYTSMATVAGAVLGILLLSLNNKELTESSIGIISRIQEGFNTMLLMISAPVTFFSFVTNITNTAMLADKKVKVKGLINKIGISSIIALILGVCYMISLRSLSHVGIRSRLIVENESLNMIKETEQVIPKDIFSAFTSASPFPLIILAILTAVAILSMNSHFVEAKALNDNINRIFASALRVIYFFLPFLIFLSVIEVILWRGAMAVFLIVIFLLICMLGMAIMFIFNMIRLRINHCNPFEFIKKCLPALQENFKINSPIEAIPYNIRFCSKYLGIKNKYADSAVPIVSQLNLDGNCFLLMFLCSSCYMMTGYEVNTGIIIGLAIVILGLSLGAPNQPGSLLIGLTIALSFIGDASGTISVVILTEAYVGRALTLINTFGNLVTVQIEAGKAGEIKNCQ